MKKKIIWNVTQGVIDGSASQQGPPSNFAVGGNEASPASSSDTTEDDGFSQAESSIKNGEVIASAQGNKWNKKSWGINDSNYLPFMLRVIQFFKLII